MRKTAADLFSSERESYICTENAVVESMNPAAKARGRFRTGDSLFEYMTPADSLKYEMLWETIEQKPPYTAVLQNCGKEIHAAFFLEEILGKRFAVAVLFDKKADLEKALSKTSDAPCPITEVISKLIEALVDVPDEKFGDRDDVGLYDIISVTERTVKDIMSMKRYFDCDVSFTFSKKDSCEAFGMGLGNFVRCISLIMYIANEISENKLISLEVVRNENSPAVMTRVQVDRAKYPSPTAPYVAGGSTFLSAAKSLCEFCAGCAGYAFSITDFRSEVILCLETERNNFGNVEFKCRDGFKGYTKYLASAKKMIGFLTAQKKNEN